MRLVQACRKEQPLSFSPCVTVFCNGHVTPEGLVSRHKEENMKTISLSLLGLGMLCSAALAAPVTLNTNGQPVTVNTVVIGGVPYVRLDDLQKALAAAGGANQRSSVEGCVNEWLFNGIWRLRVTDVQPTTNPSRGDWPGYAVKVEVRNGINQTITPEQGGLKANNAISLSFPDGNQWTYDMDTAWVDKAFGKLQPGSGLTYTFKIYPAERLNLADVKASAPSKFLLEVKTKLDPAVKARFTVPDPGFRVNLGCRK